VPSIHQVLAWAQEKVAKGKGELHTNHIVIVEEEAEKRKSGGVRDESGKLPTRIVWDAGDNQMYCEWHRENERWMQLCGSNPSVKTAAMIIGLRMYSDQQIRDIKHNLDSLPVAAERPAESSGG
jgi:hypothetical protein